MGRVLSALQDFDPSLRVLEFPENTATVAAAAAAIGVRPEQIAKSLLVKCREEFAIVVLAGESRLDQKKAKRQLGGKVTFASAEQVAEVTGHVVGGVCPFGCVNAVPVYVDPQVLAWNEIYPAAGTPNSAVRLTPSQLLAITGAEVVDLRREGEGSDA